VRFSDGELAEVEAAAAAVGMTPTGFCAQAALAVAGGLPLTVVGDPEWESLAQLQSELFAARVALNRVGTNLNQAVAALNATGEAPEWMDRAVARCVRFLEALDEVVSRIHRRLR